MLTLDVDAAAPPYEQLRTQLAGAISSGMLEPGERLPTVRALAADLGIATNTVARAYRELEAAGLVSSRRRAGTVVADRGSAAPDVRVLEASIQDLVGRAREAGVPPETVIDLVRAALSAPA